MSTPMRRMRPPGCARAASGHAAAAPPSAVINSRRRRPDTRASSLVVGPPHPQSTTTLWAGPWAGPETRAVGEADRCVLSHADRPLIRFATHGPADELPIPLSADRTRPTLP